MTPEGPLRAHTATYCSAWSASTWALGAERCSAAPLRGIRLLEHSVLLLWGVCAALCTIAVAAQSAMAGGSPGAEDDAAIRVELAESVPRHLGVFLGCAWISGRIVDRQGLLGGADCEHQMASGPRWFGVGMAN